MKIHHGIETTILMVNAYRGNNLGNKLNLCMMSAEKCFHCAAKNEEESELCKFYENGVNETCRHEGIGMCSNIKAVEDVCSSVVVVANKYADAARREAEHEECIRDENGK